MVSQLESFKDYPSLRPVKSLRDYLNKVSVTPWFDPIVYLNSKVAPAVRKDSSGIFLALVTPHLPVSASTLARWLSAYLTMGGVDYSKSKKLSARAAPTAFLKTEKSLFMKEICDLAGLLGLLFLAPTRNILKIRGVYFHSCSIAQ